MGILVAVVALVGVVLAVDLAWLPPSWTAWLPGDDAPLPPGADDERSPGGDVRRLDEGRFGEAAVRRRLDALVEELDRLDHDPDVFARAFHTRVARSAHDALVAAGFPQPGPARPSPPACLLDAVPGQSPGGAAEVLDV